VDRPKPWAMGTVRVRVHRGPRKDDPSCWYWRADKPAGKRRELVWQGWGTQAEAEAAIAKAMSGDPETIRRSGGVRTVYDLLDTWIAAIRKRADLSEKTRLGYEMTTGRLHARAFMLGDVLVEVLDRRALERYRDLYLRVGGLGGKGGAASTVRLDFRTLRLAWQWGRELGLVPDRELPNVRVSGSKGTRSKYTPSPAEVARVMAELSGQRVVEIESERTEKHLRYMGPKPLWRRRFVYLCLATGCRRGELTDLKVRDVDLERGEVRVSGKTGARTIPLHPVVLDELALWGLDEAHPDRRVWPVVPGTIHVIYEALREACEAAGVPYFPLGGLRRAAVDALYRSGEDVGTAAKVLGHSPATALRSYRQAAESDMRSAVERAALGVLPSPDGVVIPMRRREGDG
jgi:integrase